MGCAVFLFKVRAGVCKLLQAGCSVSVDPMDFCCRLISKAQTNATYLVLQCPVMRTELQSYFLWPIFAMCGF